MSDKRDVKSNIDQLLQQEAVSGLVAPAVPAHNNVKEDVIPEAPAMSTSVAANKSKQAAPKKKIDYTAFAAPKKITVAEKVVTWFSTSRFSALRKIGAFFAKKPVVNPHAGNLSAEVAAFDRSKLRKQ